MLRPKRYASDIAVELVKGLQSGEVLLEHERQANVADLKEFLFQLKKQYSPSSLLREVISLCIALVLGTAVPVLTLGIAVPTLTSKPSHSLVVLFSSFTSAVCVCISALLMSERQRRNKLEQIEKELQSVRRSAERSTQQTETENVSMM